MTDSTDFQNAIMTLRNGGIILYPTDTVWGIGCDATCKKAVEKIYRLKQREDSKSMLALVGDRTQLSEWVDNIPSAADKLLNDHNRPLTIIYDHPKGVAENLLADDGSLGIRICNYNFTSRLCLMLGHPLVSTSANISGQPTPKCFDEISEEVIKGADYVVKTGRNKYTETLPSKIVKISDNNQITIIRD